MIFHKIINASFAPRAEQEPTHVHHEIIEDAEPVMQHVAWSHEDIQDVASCESRIGQVVDVKHK